MQRKGISLFLAVIILIVSLSACKKESKTDEFLPAKEFSVHMKATKGEKAFEADITCLSYDNIEIAFTSPEELAGFSLKVIEEKYHIGVSGFTDELSDEEIKDNSLLKVLINTLRTAVFKNHGMFIEEESSYTARLTVENIPVFVSFSKNGYIRSLTAESAGFSAQFS